MNNASELKDFFINGQRNRNNTSDEFGKKSSKATSMFTVQLL